MQDEPDCKAHWTGTPMSRLADNLAQCPDASLDDNIAASTVSMGTWMYEHVDTWCWLQAVSCNAFAWRDVVRSIRPKAYPF